MFIKSKIKQFARPTSLQVYKSGHILPVLKAVELLGNNRHQSLIEEVSILSKLPDDYFASLYEDAINNFAEFVQILPMQINRPLSGLLNQSLARANLVLKNFVLDQGKNVDPLWNYAVFTAALFSDVSKVIINQKIIIVDKEGNFVDDWRPFEGSMVSLGQYYKIYSIANVFERLRHTITPLLARQLLPELGFLWISSDPKVFADWMDALRGDEDQGGKVSRALALIRREDEIALFESIPQIEVDQIESEATIHGEAFFNWLKNGIASNDIKTNTADAAVHVVDAGVFLDRKIFKQFSDLYNVPVNMHAVFTQFGNMFGIEKKGGYDYAFDQYFSESSDATSNQTVSFASQANANRKKSLRDGMVLSDPNMVFVNAQIPATSPLLKAMQPKTQESSRLPSVSSKEQLSLQKK